MFVIYEKTLNELQCSCGTKSLQPFTAKVLMPSATETPQPRVVFQEIFLT